MTFERTGPRIPAELYPLFPAADRSVSGVNEMENHNTTTENGSTENNNKDVPWMSSTLYFGKGVSVNVFRRGSGQLSHRVRVMVNKKITVSLYTNNEDDASVIIRAEGDKVQDIMIAAYPSGKCSIYKDGNNVFQGRELTNDALYFLHASIKPEMCERIRTEILPWLYVVSGNDESFRGRL